MTELLHIDDIEALINKITMKNDNIINYINEKIVKLEKEYEELGREDLEITDVYNDIKSNLNLYELTNYKFIEYKEINYLNIDNIIEEVINNYSDNKENIRTNIIKKIKKIFKENNNLKLERFDILCKYIIYEYINIIEIELTHINKWFQKSIDNFKYELTETTEISNFEITCKFNFKRYILRNLELFEITDKKLLIESDEWKLKRTALKEEITKYNNCKTIIANL